MMQDCVRYHDCRLPVECCKKSCKLYRKQSKDLVEEVRAYCGKKCSKNIGAPHSYARGVQDTKEAILDIVGENE